MGKLDDLRNLVKKAFDKADDKASIDKLAEINKSIDEVSKEQDELVKKNGELVKSYKELVQHTSFKDTKGPESTPGAGQTLSLEDELNAFIENESQKNKK